MCRSMHTQAANIAHNTLGQHDGDLIRTTNMQELKTTNMADMCDRRTGREKDLSDK